MDIKDDIGFQESKNLAEGGIQAQSSSLESGPLAVHPEDQAPYGARKNGTNEHTVARVVPCMPGTGSSCTISALDDFVGQSHITGNEQQNQSACGEEVFGSSHGKPR